MRRKTVSCPGCQYAREMGALREHAEQHSGNRKSWRENLATLDQGNLP